MTETILEGLQAPEFTLPDEKGNTITLEDFKGKQYVVLYFYPRDSTPGCTTEACDFRDRFPEFEKLQATVLGVSTDSAKKHQNFIAKNNLPFPLLVDAEAEAAKAYGVWKKKNMYGKEFEGIERSTFLIAPTGEVLKEWRKVKVAGHVEEIQQVLEQVQKESS
ncbi:thioredoxin-dependent thiol peroxidase [Chryseomicrobium sp. FSL W7-1435]|uniref:thioredoxin-dependent thiol peroxidase n=1 Tax=Chryseomicrobium sp. FSL W7-1435 TaxID=2921704 RepID=UPI00315AFFB9